MNLKTFFNKFLTKKEKESYEKHLQINFNSVNHYADFKTEEVNDLQFLGLISENLNAGEKNLIRKMSNIHTMTGYHTVPYDNKKFPLLIMHHYLLKDKNGKGVIHQDIIKNLNKAVDIPVELNNLKVPKGINLIKESFGNSEYNALLEILNSPIEEFYDAIPTENVKAVAENMGLNTAAMERMDMVDHIIMGVTDAAFLEMLMSDMEQEEYKKLKKHIKEDDAVFRKGEGDLIITSHLGLIVQILPNYSVMHPDVFNQLKNLDYYQIEENRLEQRNDQSSVGAAAILANSYKLRVELKHVHTPIWREIIVPARHNFYELHLIIQEAFGWQNSHLSRFTNKDMDIVTLSVEEPGDEKPALLASYTQVDAMFMTHHTFEYLYDYGDGWVHSVELLGLAESSSPYPFVDKKEGLNPIENVGGPEGLEETMKILKDKSHPEHKEIKKWTKSMGYKQRYYINQVNDKLTDMFDRGTAITELNDPDLID